MAAPGVAEVLHAQFVDHAYPVHTHDTWTLLIVDDGAIRYDLDRHHHDAVAADVTLLPPHVPHDGRAATGQGFRKRVVYLDESALSGRLVGAAASGPNLRDPLLRQRVDQLHGALDHTGDELEAESRLALIEDRLQAHLSSSVDTGDAVGTVDTAGTSVGRGLAPRLRELLDERVVSGLTLAEASALLQANTVHLVRSFSATYGIAPHAYLVGRRIDRARRLLLSGHTPAETATRAGFYDQAHLTRMFRRYLGTTPARFARAPR